MPPKSYKKRSYKKKTTRRRPKVNSVAQLSKDNHAKVSDTIVLTPAGTHIQTDTVENFNWNLSMFPRAVAIAASYQEFRLDYVECRIKPLYDTYSAVGTAVGIQSRTPQLYFQIVKDGDTATDQTTFLHNGINPVNMSTDKNIVYRLKPAIRMGQVAAGQPTGGFTTIKVSPWLNTNDTASSTYAPNTASHYGVTMLIDSRSGATTNVDIADVEFEGHFSFRKPQYARGSTSQPIKVNGELML